MKTQFKVVGLVLTYAAISFGALISNSGTVLATYNEECLSEGCDREELRDLYDSFQNECFVEGCWAEEVFELAGADRADNPFAPQTKINQMFGAFERDLGVRIPSVGFRTDPRPNLITGILERIGVITIGKCQLDPNFNPSNCRVGPWPQ